MLKYIKSLLLLVMLTFASMAGAVAGKGHNPSQKHQSSSCSTICNHADLSHASLHDLVTLREYISRSCKIGCVDAGVLLQALYDAKEDLGNDSKTFLAMVRQESNFRVQARNGINVGLAQINLRYHKPKFRSGNTLNPADNLRVGSIVYGDCRRKHHNNSRQAVRCYNGYHLGDGAYHSKILTHLRDINSLNLQTL